jgi:dipeptidase D
MESATGRILEYFEQINAIPRCSGNEAGVAAWLKSWAAPRGFAYREDAIGNLVIDVPGAVGHEHAPTVILQGHMDMVCEKTPDSPHDFSRDPIRSHREGDWLKADRTTLGADNGIALAYALALAEDPRIARPPLELLCTVDEESGLSGVMKMGPDLITGKTLINIDSEDEGVFTIGCSGGREVRLGLALETVPVPSDWKHYSVTLGGLTGGHSGIDIGKSRANANRLLARVLAAIVREIPEVRLANLSGGSRHNAIARDARAVIVVPPGSRVVLENTAEHMAFMLREDHKGVEPALSLEISPAPASVTPVCGQAAIMHLADLIVALPHGVQGISASMPGLVESSCNLAVVSSGQGRADILISLRSSVASRLTEMIAQARAIARFAGADVQESKGYPAWEPQPDSLLLRRACTTYRTLFEQEPVVQVIHAGLECAIIGGRYPGMEMISIGPTIRNPHSPDERLYVPSVERVWRFLVALLEEYARH